MATARTLLSRSAFPAEAGDAARFAPAPANAFDRRLAAALQRHIAKGSVRVELWDGSWPAGAPAAPIGDLIVRDRRTLLGLILNPDLYFGECYVAGRLDVRGPLEPVLEALSRLVDASPTWRATLAAHLGLPNTLGLARQNVHHHYDLGNEFYERWLDDRMVYTCAYFAQPGMTLEQAQIAKMELVCRKLRLRPGERVIEAGCGWGALALYMARHYGVTRDGVQHLARADRLRARARRRGGPGAPGRVRRGRLPQRHWHAATRSCRSACSSTSGCATSALWLACCNRVAPTGRRPRAAALHRPQRAAPLNAVDPPPHLPRRVRADAREVFDARARAGRHVGARRREPAPALRAHARRLGAAGSRRRADEVRAGSTKSFVRAWRLYLAGSQAAFATGWLQLFQVVFARRVTPHAAWTRDDPLECTGDAGCGRCDVLDRRRRSGRIDVCARRCGAPAATWWSSTARASRATRSAPAGSRPRWSRLLDLDSRRLPRAGRTLQPITRLPHRRHRSRRRSRRATTRVVSYGIRRCEFDALPARARRRARVASTPVVTSLQRSRDRWIVNDTIAAPMLVGAGGHFCPVARHLRGDHDGMAPVVAKEAEFQVTDPTGALRRCPRCTSAATWRVTRGASPRTAGSTSASGVACRPASPRTSRPSPRSLARDPALSGIERARWKGHAYLAAGAGTRPLIGLGMLAIGDAAGLAYPESGEGIRPAIASGQLAAATLVAADGRVGRDALQPYAEEIRRQHPPMGRHPRWMDRATASVARMLLRSPAFTRHVVLDRWFLRRQSAAAPQP